jgi:hypothetical protein
MLGGRCGRGYMAKPVNRRGPSADEGYQLAVRIFSVTIIGFGLAMLVLTVARGGGPLAVGVLFGLLFIALGSGRLYLSMRG